MAPSDPRLRAATVGGFTFGGSDPPYCILAVQDGKSGITTIPGQLMGKSLWILHIVVTHSLPTPYRKPHLHTVAAPHYMAHALSVKSRADGARLTGWCPLPRALLLSQLGTTAL